jgi:hypothetical protein
MGSCEHGNESSGSIKGEEFLEWLRKRQRMKDSAPWSCLVVSQCVSEVVGPLPR